MILVLIQIHVQFTGVSLERLAGNGEHQEECQKLCCDYPHSCTDGSSRFSSPVSAACAHRLRRRLPATREVQQRQQPEIVNLQQSAYWNRAATTIRRFP
jgi:hypothetical protein